MAGNPVLSNKKTRICFLNNSFRNKIAISHSNSHQFAIQRNKLTEFLHQKTRVNLLKKYTGLEENVYSPLNFRKWPGPGPMSLAAICQCASYLVSPMLYRCLFLLDFHMAGLTIWTKLTAKVLYSVLPDTAQTNVLPLTWQTRSSDIAFYSQSLRKQPRNFNCAVRMMVVTVLKKPRVLSYSMFGQMPDV